MIHYRLVTSAKTHLSVCEYALGGWLHGSFPKAALARVSLRTFKVFSSSPASQRAIVHDVSDDLLSSHDFELWKLACFFV